MPKRTILISGAGGFIGTPLTDILRDRGDRVIALTRGAAGEDRVHWGPETGELDSADIAGCDAVVHLAGESIAGRWTGGKKRKILESRQRGTHLLAEAAAGLTAKPSVFVSSSAIGYYGDRGDQILNESSGNGSGFLAEVAREWEAAADPARDAGIRAVNLRIGLVLGEGGGALGAMKRLFKLGGGGKLGSGEQWWSWVTLNDVVRAFVFALDSKNMEGAYNVAAPEPATNAEFTKELAHALHRPALLTAPAFALKLAMREMASEMLLASQRADAGKIQKCGFEFDDVQLPTALAKSLD